MTLRAARLKAHEVLRNAGEGIDAVAEKKAAAAEAQQRKLRGDAFEDLAEKCMEAIAHEIRDRTAQEYRRILKANVYPRIGKVRPEAVTKGDIREALRAVEKQGRIAANRTLAVVRRVFNWAASQDLVPASPVVGLKPSSEVPRADLHRRRVAAHREGTGRHAVRGRDAADPVHGRPDHGDGQRGVDGLRLQAGPLDHPRREAEDP
jgi:hypothetical protein